MFRKILVILALMAAPATAKSPSILTDIPAVHSLVSQITQGLQTPDILLSAGSDPHAFQLRPTQARNIANADIIFWVGPALTPWLERAITGIDGRAKSVILLEHSFNNEDAHAWLDPQNAIRWLDVIASELSIIDPLNADQYKQNATLARANISDMMGKLRQALEPVQSTPILVFHDAFNHFATRFDLTIAGAIHHGDATNPGAAHLAEIQGLIANNQIACAFGEAGHDPDIINTLLNDAGITVGQLDPLGSYLEFGPDLYETLIRNIAEQFAVCRK